MGYRGAARAMRDEGGTEMAKKRRDVEERSVNRGRKRLKREREREREGERGGKENERGRRRAGEHGAATACVSRLNECKPRSGGSPLDLLFSSPDSL